MKVVPRAGVDPVFERQLRALRDRFAEAAEAADSGGQARWAAPELRSWSGSLDDREGMAAAFDRSEANRYFADATADGENPGTTGDLVAAAFQAHYLGAMERAYRQRHLKGPRAFAHAAARDAGLGDNRGPLVRCALEYARNVVARSKGAKP